MRWTQAASLAAGAGLARAFWEPRHVTTRHFEVFLPGLPLGAEGLKIVQMSDLHVSAVTGAKMLRHVVDSCNALQPDVVALTGDYVSRRNSYFLLSGARVWARPLAEYAEQMAREVSRLRARLAVLAVPGNHDYADGSFDFVGDLLEAAGAQVLVDRSVRVAGVPFVGLADVRAGRTRPAAACEGVGRDEAQVILSHNPRLILLLRNRNALILSGHTHGGQVCLPLTRFRLRPGDMGDSPWMHGWYRQEGAQMYVSSGVGSVHFPLRLRCRPEMTVFVLRRAAGEFEF